MHNVTSWYAGLLQYGTVPGYLIVYVLRDINSRSGKTWGTVFLLLPQNVNHINAQPQFEIDGSPDQNLFNQ
jgi:hypothetical protein